VLVWQMASAFDAKSVDKTPLQKAPENPWDHDWIRELEKDPNLVEVGGCLTPLACFCPSTVLRCHFVICRESTVGELEEPSAPRLHWLWCRVSPFPPCIPLLPQMRRCSARGV
jgi:hypothetical protein